MEFEFFNPDEIGYHVPQEILDGDFRKMEGESDPDAPYASRLVSERAENPTQDMFEAVHTELSRLRATFNDINAKGDRVSLDAYWYARDLYGKRIAAILAGETDLPNR